MPRYTREQVQQRRRLAVGVIGLILLVMVASCGATATRLLRDQGTGGAGAVEQAASTPARTRRAEPDALTVPHTPGDAAILSLLPAGASLEEGETAGIDVSAHQGEIDWKAVRAAGASFAYIKATEGVGHLDERLNANWSGAHRAGLARGAYHYFTLCSTGADQAEAFLAAVPPDDSALPPAIDLELDGQCDAKPSAAEVKKEVAAFITAVEKSWGRRVVVYSSQQWRDAYPLPDDIDRPSWISSIAERPQGDWVLWQVRFDARIEGIDHAVDLDVMRIDPLLREAKLDAAGR